MNSGWDNYGEQGYDLYISKYLFSPLGEADTSTWTIFFYLQDLMTGYGVQALSSGTVNIISTTDGGQTYVALKSEVATGTNIGEIAGNTLPSEARLLTHIRAIAMNDLISIRINDGIPFTTPARIATVTSGQDPAGQVPDYQTLKYPRFRQCSLNVINFSTVAFAGWPLKWMANTNYISARYSLGFSPSNSPVFDIRTIDNVAVISDGGSVDLSTFTDNPTCTVSASIDPESFYEAAPQFSLNVSMPVAGTWSSIPFATHTVALTGVSMRYLGIYNPPDNGDNTGYQWQYCNQDNQYTPKSMSLTEQFDLNSLSIHRSAEVTFSNWYGVQDMTAATGVAGIGNVAMAMDFGYIGDALQRRFTGYVDTFSFDRPGPGAATCTMFGTDRMQQLSESYIFDPPNMDNWYHYYAIQYLAECAGIPDNQLFMFTYDPNGTVVQIFPPDNPYEVSGNDPDPWGLPIGTAAHAWTPIQRQLPVLELMEYVRKAAACVLYFDQNGYLVYGPWIPVNPYYAFKKTFYEVPIPVTDPALDLNECWNISVRNSTRNTRTQVTLVSIDPVRPGFISPPTTARDVTDSQVNAPPGIQPYNYIGYRKVAAISDARFGFQAFRQRAARAYFSTLSQPDVAVSITTWMQPDLNILDVITVNDTRSNISALPLTITGHQIGLSATDQGQIPVSHLTANYYVWPSNMDLF